MSFSVNTNASAFLALQNLHKTNKDLARVQTRINTGLKVSSAKDDAATYAIAQTLRGDVAGLGAVSNSLKRAGSSLDVAIAAAEAVSDLLIEMKEKAVAAKDSGLDTASRQSLSRDFAQLRDQITSIIENAEFNGVNAVKANGRDISAITDPTASKTLNIAAQDLSLGGANVAISAGQTIDTVAFASLAVDQLTAAIDNVNASLSTLGAGAKRLEIQQSFVAKLSGTIEVGIGNLVDADLAKEAANLQALQVKQQLGLQALSIANQSPSSILSLFR
ncbi:flagellin [Kordiimonas sp.]|uniref:flagellin n=1 Tax=Kordiimonas sp. TaxID=1970157 RepID=UPI003A8FC0F4